MVNETDALYPEGYWEDPSFDEQEAKEKEAAIANKYVSLYAMDVQAKKKIAQAEAYVREPDSENPDYRIEMRLKFGDGSLADLKTYSEEGFEDFIDQINSMISDLNGKYEMDIAPI
jgi:hypothetical protein